MVVLFFGGRVVTVQLRQGDLRQTHLLAKSAIGRTGRSKCQCSMLL